MTEYMQFCAGVSRVRSLFRSDVEALQAGLIFRYPFIWASARKNVRGLRTAHAQSDQHLYYSFLESIISRLATSEISNF